MRRPPPLNTCFAYPITTSVAAFAVLATVRWWSGADIGRFVAGPDQWWREPWLLLTPALFHLDPIHLIFNLYWLWVFGTKIEEEFGPGPTAAAYALLAAGSNAAEVAVFRGGVGLSGVGYGLFGLLWVLARNDARFRDAVDRRTIQLLVGWFFLCIVLTAAGLWRVGNVAHGAGCVLGALLGWTICARTIGLRVRNAAILAAVVLLFLAGATVARPYVNLTKAVAIDPQQYGWWNNLAIAYLKIAGG